MKRTLVFFALLLLSLTVQAQGLRTICVRFDIEIGCMEWGNDLQFYDFRFDMNPDDYKVQQPKRDFELQVNGTIKAGDSKRDQNATIARNYGAGVAYGFGAFFEHFRKMEFTEQVVKDNFIAVKHRVNEIGQKDQEETARAKNSIPRLHTALQDFQLDLKEQLKAKKDDYKKLDKELDELCQRIECGAGKDASQQIPGHLDYKVRDEVLSQKREQLLNGEGSKKLSENTLRNIYHVSGTIQNQANNAFDNSDFETAEAGQSLAMSLVNFGLDLVPLVSDAKGIYEAIVGENPISGEKLSSTDRVISAVASTVGIISLGTLGGATKAALNSAKALAHLPEVSNVFNRAGKIIGSLEGVGFKEVEQAKEFLDTRLGKSWAKIQDTGKAITDEGHKFFNRNASVSNPLPEDGVFARLMKKEDADALENGGLLSRPYFEDVDDKSVLVSEAFITAAEDIKGLDRYDDIVRKLSLYSDPSGKVYRVRDGDYVVIEFKFNGRPNIYSPIETKNGREWGWVAGGKTAGGAREWLVNPEAISLDLIDKSTIKQRVVK